MTSFFCGKKSGEKVAKMCLNNGKLLIEYYSKILIRKEIKDIY